MKLTYKIIWIDDDIEDYIGMGIKSEFEGFLENLGFISTVECFENGTTAKESLHKLKYDLILSDYKIEGGGEQGDVLIQKIRDGGIFTEVLFYSAQSNFDQIAKNIYRDRVSFFSLIGDESLRGFKSKVFTLIELTVSKLQELNNIRGLVMSETSELDNVIEGILFGFLSIENRESIKLRTYINKIILESAKGNLNNAEKITDLDNITLIKNRIFDADKKSRAINKLLEIKKMEKTEPFVDFYAKYKKDVIDKRNDLAHAKSDTIDGVDYLLVSRKDGELPEKYDQEMCVQIRKSLRNHSDILKSIRDALLPSN